MKEAGPSEPALILGLNGAPAAGDTFHVIETEQEAREIANKREQLQREQGLRTQKMLTLDEVGRRLALGDFHELNIIVKGDVDGSVEALSDSLIKLVTFVKHGFHLTVACTCKHNIAHLQSTVGHEYRSHITTTLIQLGLDDGTGSATVGVCFQFQHFGFQQYFLHQIAYTDTFLG